MGQVEALRRCVLRDCNDDIGGHLVNCQLSTESLTETDFILASAAWSILGY